MRCNKLRADKSNRFRAHTVQQIISTILDKKLENQIYSSEDAETWTKELADEVKAALMSNNTVYSYPGGSHDNILEVKDCPELYFIHSSQARLTEHCRSESSTVQICGECISRRDQRSRRIVSRKSLLWRV